MDKLITEFFKHYYDLKKKHDRNTATICEEMQLTNIEKFMKKQVGTR
jgi:hypothetical protein